MPAFRQSYALGVTPRSVAIVPHTHWDREWYEPFQVFRVQLVQLLDELLPMLDRDLSYSRFLLDGQTVVLDDYLEIRPDQADTITRLVASGRVSIGPWKCLMDEFMVSGETIVRNLQAGMLRARRSSAARCRSATSPTCSDTSPRCPRSCVSPASGTPWCGGACRWRSTPRDSGGLLPTGHACAPSTCTARTRTDATSRVTPSDSAARAATTSSSSATRHSTAAACC